LRKKHNSKKLTKNKWQKCYFDKTRLFQPVKIPTLVYVFEKMYRNGFSCPFVDVVDSLEINLLFGERGFVMAAEKLILD
jgi:hypothetical protein